MLTSPTPGRKRAFAVFAGLLFCIKLTVFSHSSIQAISRSSKHVELLSGSSSRDGRDQSLLDGPRIIPHLTAISTCCHAHCGGARVAGDYQCACCSGNSVTQLDPESNAAASPQPHESSSHTGTSPRSSKDDADQHSHTGRRERKSSAMSPEEEQHQWHEKHQYHRQQQQQADLSRYAPPPQSVQQPKRVPEGSTQARPVDSVVRAQTQKSPLGNPTPSAGASVHPSGEDAAVEPAHAQTARHSSKTSRPTAVPQAGSPASESSDTGYHGPRFVKDERKRERDAGLNPPAEEPKSSLNREEVWGPMGDGSTPPSARDRGHGAEGAAGQPDHRASRSSNQVFENEPSTPLDSFVGTNIVFHGMSSDGGIPRARRGRHHSMLARAHVGKGQGMLADEEAAGGDEEGGDEDEDEDEDEMHEFSWDKSWWGGKEWVIYLLACPIPTVLIFINGFLGQDLMCALIYMAFLLPLDVIAFYYDVYAYHDDEASYLMFLAMFVILDFLLCICILPAFAHWSLKNEERGAPPAGQQGNGGGYGATGFGGFGNFQAFQGNGQSTGYGQRTANTQMV